MKVVFRQESLMASKIMDLPHSFSFKNYFKLNRLKLIINIF